MYPLFGIHSVRSPKVVGTRFFPPSPLIQKSPSSPTMYPNHTSWFFVFQKICGPRIRPHCLLFWFLCCCITLSGSLNLRDKVVDFCSYAYKELCIILYVCDSSDIASTTGVSLIFSGYIFRPSEMMGNDGIMEGAVCASPNCGKAAKLRCPTCIKLHLSDSYFCSQV